MNIKNKRLITLCFTLIMCIPILSGCSKKPDTLITEETVETNFILRELKVEDYVTLGDYKHLNVEYAQTEITDEMIQEFIDQTYADILPESYGITDRAVATNDMVNFNVTVHPEGETEPTGPIEHINVKVGAGQFIKGFDEHLIGKMPGDKETFTLTFPENYESDEALAGKTATFDIEVNYIVPVDNKTDEIINEYLNQENIYTVEMFETWAKHYIEEQAALKDEETFNNAVLDAFMESCTFAEELPENMTELYKQRALENINNIAASAGMNTESYVQHYHDSTLDEFINTYALDAAKQHIAMQAVANVEGMTISDEYIRTELESNVDGVYYTSVDQILEENDIESYRDYFMYERIYAYLTTTAKENTSKD